MNKYIKKMISMVVTVCTVFSLSFVSADSPWRGVDQYRKYVDKQQKPRTLILGSGRGEFRVEGIVLAKEYDQCAYNDRKYDYFLVDCCGDFKPDFKCDATEWNDIGKLGPGTWDKCILECLPHSVSMSGALRNALRLVKPGGKVYINATDFFRIICASSLKRISEKLATFKSFLVMQAGLNLQTERPIFYEVLSTRPLWEKLTFFNAVYNVDKNIISDIKLVPGSLEVWPQSCVYSGLGLVPSPPGVWPKDCRYSDMRVWEITKA